ncbi:MAG: FHA domain-containing protein [Coleofasciculaceae cyanobacterium]
MTTQYIHKLVIEESQEFLLTEPVYSIGRGENDIGLYSRYASRYTATLIRQVREDGSYFYQIVDGDGEDNLSSMGLFINGQRCQSHYLQNEDEIMFNTKIRGTYHTTDTRPTVPAKQAE